MALLMVLKTAAPATTNMGTGVIADSRVADWSGAGATITDRTTIYTSLTSSATAAEINKAIQDCTAGQTVYLEAGTYTINDRILAKANVTLRGAGPSLTKLIFTNIDDQGNIYVQSTTGYWAGSTAVLTGDNQHTWTAGYSRGTTDITLNSVAGLSPGMEIILDQEDDQADTGEWVVGDKENVLSDEGACPGRKIDGVTNRAQQQYVTISAINGFVVTISPGLYASNWRSGMNPGVWWVEPMEGFGIESMSLDHLSSGTEWPSYHYGIYFNGAKNCWVKNVRSLKLERRNHIDVYLSSHITIRDSYFWGGPLSSQGYQLEFFLSGDLKTENNIHEYSSAPIMNGPTVGTVHAFNYGVNMRSQDGSAMNACAWHHDAGVEFCLYEGNQINGIHSDNFHGPCQAITYFRNRFTGHEAGTTVAYYDAAFLTRALNRYHNIIGNVLGEAAYHDTYEQYTPTAESWTPKPIYELGHGNGIPDDVLTRNTMFRWGNYDVVNAAVRWESSEVPSGISPYANPVPGDHVLPVSLYMTAQPAWWPGAYGAVVFPPIGPDVTGGNGPGGFSYDIPAKRCYDTMAVDTNYNQTTYPGLKLFVGW